MGRSATGIVLFLLCLMYFITYVDRVNIATAATAIKGEFKPSNTAPGLAFPAFGHAPTPRQLAGGGTAARLGSG